MKKRTLLSNLRIFNKKTGSRKIRRRYHKTNNLQFDSLEARNLLATVSFDAGAEALTFQSDAGVADVVTVSALDADTLQIQVEGGEAIVLSGDAIGNSDFVLSQSVSVDDTLQINVGSSIVSDFVANLGDLDDVFSVISLPGIASFFVAGESGNDTLDASAAFSDVLFAGGSGNDTLTGGAGDDVLAGGEGTDVINGGDGVDTNSFAGIGVGVVATVDADGNGTADYGTVNEVFSGIENLTGSENDDVLTATGAAANVLRGEGGNDVLAGGEGTDVIDGGDGIDTNSFAGIGFGVVATIDADGNGTADYGTVNETFMSIENLIGSSNTDILTGNDLSNQIEGGLGGDIINGLGGDDSLFGGTVSGDAVAQETGFSLALSDQPLASLTTEQTPSELVIEAANNNLYFNVHTNDFPGGEIRGQLILQSDETVDGVRTLTLATLLDGSQEPDDASDSTANGEGSVIITVDGSSVTYESTLSIAGITVSDLLPVSGVSSIHIHNAPAGVNGPVITDVIQGAGGDVNGVAVNPIFDTGDGNVFVEAFQTDNDIINGGNGNDALTGGDGNDILRGGNGDDIAAGGEGDDALNGGSGDDTLSGGNGDDFLAGGGGTDVIDGGAGIDTNSFQGIGVGVAATVNADGTGEASYGEVNETFVGIENVTGSVNNDVLTAVGLADNVLRGLGGDDILNGGNGDDLLVGNAGNDILRGSLGDDVQLGGVGDDALNGGSGNDFLSGGAGDDFFAGVDGTDVISGGSGFDRNSFQGIGVGVTARINDDGSGTAQYGQVFETFTSIEGLTGSENDDVLIVTGSIGRTIRGAGGDDLIFGGFGDDILLGNAGNDTIRARGGNDIVFGNSGDDDINAGEGDDFARGDEGNDTLAGAAGIDVLVGSEGDDVIFGGAGFDSIFAGAGADSLFGGDGDDELNGGDGDDILFGGLGDDLLFGGDGDDQEFQ